MSNTTLQSLNPTVSFDGNTKIQPPAELLIRYDEVLASRNLSWTAHLRMERVLGRGGQGVVFFSRRRGADGFTLPIALKVFSPERYEDVRSYDMAMGRIARVASHIAQIQHDNLLSVQDFYDRNHIRIMAMEWIDGYDLRRLLNNERLAMVEGRVSSKRWADINRMVLTEGPVQPRVMPGVAVAIVRDCLSALAALHREEIVHGDMKPGNIMLKLTGRAKIIDMGSAFEIDDPPQQRSCTPTYAAPEVLEGEVPTPRSDLASLGYVLIELMAGKPL
ncbi:MAG: serine/threonine-protein kinase, partial [Planctomycetota bacterium]